MSFFLLQRVVTCMSHTCAVYTAGCRGRISALLLESQSHSGSVYMQGPTSPLSLKRTFGQTGQLRVKLYRCYFLLQCVVSTLPSCQAYISQRQVADTSCNV